MAGRTLSVLALFALVSLPLAAQTNPAIPRASETIEVSIVNLDVYVTDKHGNRVTGLTKEDFQVLEDGNLQPISNFSEYRPEARAVVSESTAKALRAAPAPRQPRTIVVFVDDIKLGHLQIDPVFEALKKTLRETVLPGDTVTVIRWAMHPVIVQPPTDDMTKVGTALDRIAASSIGNRVDDMQRTRDLVDQLYVFLAEAANFANSRGGPKGVPAGIGMAAPSIDDDLFTLEARSGAEVALYEMREKVKALNAIVTSMSGVEGKKALLIVSHRLGFYAGGEYFYSFRERIPDSDRSRFDTTALVKSLTDNANAHGVTLYTMFPEGLQTPQMESNNDPSRMVAGQSPLFDPMRSNYQLLGNEITNLKRIADETGGTMAYSGVDIAKMLPKVREDFDSYYSLAYRIGARHDDKERKVAVRVKNREYRVRTRQHYFESSVQKEMHDRVVGNLLRVPEASNIPIEVVVGEPARKEKKLWAVPIEVHFPSAALTAFPDGDAKKGGFTVYIATGRLFGASADVTRQTVPFTVKPVGNPEKFSYEFMLTTDLLSDRISIGILDEVSHETGFAVAKLPTGAARVSLRSE